MVNDTNEEERFVEIERVVVELFGRRRKENSEGFWILSSE